ncbi:MAG TPA: glycosyltransferase [Bryobacteraceae bacterium]|nr:glycosyltransferase [Bryobacteraceae bacterium]
MKLLWVKSDFLHPPDRGGQIRTLETLKRLHRRHEVHYIGLKQPGEDEGPRRAGEYSSRWYAVEHVVPDKTSLAFAGQLARGLFDRVPVAVSRFRSRAMRRQLHALLARQKFDAVVCDFLFPAANIPDLAPVTLFQHNVEALIWQRRLAQANNPLQRAYIGLQARRMERFEREVCRSVGSIIAVSEQDAEIMRREYGAARVSAVPTGVDTDCFRRPEQVDAKTDLVFVGSMDWMPNIDGALWFANEVLPLIRKHVPECTLAVAGRRPAAEIQELARRDSGITVTGTIPDVRPWIWGARAAIVPLRIGGGTRIKIYEAMAAGTPVVSTTIGAEGLDVRNGDTILLADDAAGFADACISLLRRQEQAGRISGAARDLVSSRYSWDAVADAFEKLLTSK